MMDPRDYLPDLEVLAARPGPFLFPWPVPGNPGGLVSFADASRWRDFVLSLGVHPSLPEVVRLKFYRAQKLYYLGWLDRKSTRLNSSHQIISYAVFCLKKKTTLAPPPPPPS